MVNKQEFEEDTALLVSTLEGLLIEGKSDDIPEIVDFLDYARKKYQDTYPLMEEKLSKLVDKYISMYIEEAERIFDPELPPVPCGPHFRRYNNIRELDTTLKQKEFQGVISKVQESEMHFFYFLNLCGYFKESAYSESNAAKAFSYGILYLIRNFRNHYKVELPSKVTKIQQEFEKRVVGSNKKPGPYNQIRKHNEWPRESTQILIDEIPRGLPKVLKDIQFRSVIRAIIDSDYRKELRQRKFDEKSIDMVIYRSHNMIDEMIKSEIVEGKRIYKHVWK